MRSATANLYAQTYCLKETTKLNAFVGQLYQLRHVAEYSHTNEYNLCNDNEEYKTGSYK